MTPSRIKVRIMRGNESQPVAAQARRTFMLSVAPHYGPEGVKEFMAYADPKAMLSRIRLGNVILVAELDSQLAGMIEIRNLSHIAMFFVAPGRQRGGIGRKLLARALEVIRKRNPGVNAITVNASPNAVAAYERFGFKQTGEPVTRRGIAFHPMTLKLDQYKS